MFKRTVLSLQIILYIITAQFTTITASSLYNNPNDTKPYGLSTYVCVIDADTGIIVYGKNEFKRAYPASITKVMTALLLLESTDNMNEKIYFSYDAVHSIPYNSSHIAMNEDETLTVEEALYGLLLPSANEVANAIAEHVSGSTEEFANLMNTRAKELGATNTHFVNANGLHDENHYSTAYDMSLIMREAIKHPEFVEIAGTNFFAIPPTEKQPEQRPLNNTNKLIRDTSAYYDPNILCGKTGFTDEARHTIVNYGKKDNQGLIITAMHGEKNEPYLDTINLTNYYYDKFSTLTIASDTDTYTNLPVVNGKETIGILPVIATTTTISVPEDFKLYNVSQTDTLPDTIDHTVEKGDKVGTLNFTYNNILVAQSDLIADESYTVASTPTLIINNDIPEPKHFSLLYTILKIIGTLFALLVITVVTIRQVNKRKRLKYHKKFKSKYKYK